MLARHRRCCTSFVVAAAIAGGPGGVVISKRAVAAELSAPDSRPTIEVHGFVSQGYIKTFRNRYLADADGAGSFEFSEVGLNFTSQLTDRFRVGLQLFAHNLGSMGNYDARADWYYLDYRHADWLGVRAGRLKIPFGLYNEVRDIDAARPTVLLPTSIYSPTARDFVLAQSGAEIYGYLGPRRAGALEYRLYGGTIFLDIPPASVAMFPRFRIPYVGGGRLMWETPIEGLRVGASGQILSLDLSVMPAGAMTLVDTTAEIYLGVASIEYVHSDLLMAAEYSRQRAHVVSTNFELFPGPEAKVNTVSERAYLLLAYRLDTWLQLAGYYAVTYPDEALRSGRGNMLHDLAATLRFDLNNFWLLKVEGHLMQGTAGLAPTAAARAGLPERWGMILVKTTAYF